MWAVASFEQFIFDHRDVVGSTAPHIMARAVQAGQSIGLIGTDKARLFDIMGGDMLLCGMYLADIETTRHRELHAAVVDQPVDSLKGRVRKLTVASLANMAYILFGWEVPTSLDPFLEGQSDDARALNTIIRDELAKLGVEWPTDIFQVG